MRDAPVPSHILSRRALLSGAILAPLLVKPAIVGAAPFQPSTDGIPRDTRAPQPKPVVVSGARLVVDGARYTIRGASIGDPLLARSGRTPPTDMTILARDWGFNTVRISIHPGTWRADAGAALLALDLEMEAARAAGLRSIIDWHAIGWPAGSRYEPPMEWNLDPAIYDTDLTLAHHFWVTMAARYGARPDVMFELWNEPVQLDAASREPGADWSLLKPVYEELLALIRPLASNLVLVAGGSWAADFTGVGAAPLADENVAYSWHVYPGTEGGDPARLKGLLAELHLARPVIVTEWGFGGTDSHLAGDAQSFGEAFFNTVIEANDFGWVAWCWHPSWQPSLIEADWKTPTDYGHLIKRSLLR